MKRVVIGLLVSAVLIFAVLLSLGPVSGRISSLMPGLMPGHGAGHGPDHSQDTVETEAVDFKLYSSFSETSGNKRRTELNVISGSGDPERVFEEAEQLFNRMNGTPYKLTIYLYRSEEALERGETEAVWERCYE